MNMRKITAAEYDTNKKTHKSTVKSTVPTVKVFNGNTKIVDKLFTIEAGIYKWLILVPSELLSELNWNEVFRHGLIKQAIRKNDRTPVKVKYTTYITEADGVLFAFK